MAMRKKSWNELSARQQKLVVVGGAIEIAATAWALADLSRRPAHEVNGSKALWALGCFVQPVGPLLYLTVGRRTA